MQGMHQSAVTFSVKFCVKRLNSIICVLQLEYPLSIADSMICAGERGKDSCQVSWSISSPLLAACFVLGRAARTAAR
jgi:hypothetical protein